MTTANNPKICFTKELYQKHSTGIVLSLFGIINLMTKNPFINAICASAYIILGVLIMTFITRPLSNRPDTLFAPIVFLSLLTLSVAVMAYLFFYQPLVLFIEGKKKDSVSLLTKTIGIFAAITAISLVLLSFGLI